MYRCSCENHISILFPIDLFNRGHPRRLVTPASLGFEQGLLVLQAAVIGVFAAPLDVEGDSPDDAAIGFEQLGEGEFVESHGITGPV